MANDGAADSENVEQIEELTKKEKRQAKKDLNADLALRLRLEEKINDLKNNIAWIESVLPTGKDEEGNAYDKKDLQSELKNSKKELASSEKEFAECETRIAEKKQLLGITPESEAASKERAEKTARFVKASFKSAAQGILAFFGVGIAASLVGITFIPPMVLAISAGALTTFFAAKKRLSSDKKSDEGEESAVQENKKTLRAQKRIDTLNFLIRENQSLLDGMSDTESMDARVSIEEKIKKCIAERDRLQAKIDRRNMKNTLPEDPFQAYIALLHAKTTMFRTKFQKEIISKGEEIAKNFREAAEGRLNGASSEVQDWENSESSQLKVLADISSEISKGLKASKGFMEKAITAFRKPGASTARLVLGLALMAGGIAIHGLTIGAIGLSIAPMIAAPAAVGTLLFGIGVGLGVVGRFLGADALYDKIHLMVTGRAKNGETAVAARIFRNDEKKIGRMIGKAYTTTEEIEVEDAESGNEKQTAKSTKLSREVSIENLDSALQGYAANIRKNKFFKTAISIAAAVVVPAFQFFGAEHSTVVTQAPRAPPVESGSPADSAYVSADSTHVASADSTALDRVSAKPAVRIPRAAPSGGSAFDLHQNNLTTIVNENTYAVGKGQGVWHVAEKIAEKNIPGLSAMSGQQKLMAVDAIKDAIIKNPANFGLKSISLHPGTNISCTFEQMKSALAAGGVKIHFPDVSKLGTGGFGTFKPASDSLFEFQDTLAVRPDTLAFSDSTAVRDSLFNARDSLYVARDSLAFSDSTTVRDSVAVAARDSTSVIKSYRVPIESGRQDSGFWGDFKQAFNRLFGIKPKPMPLPKQRGVLY